MEEIAGKPLPPLYREYLERFGYQPFDILGWSDVPSGRNADGRPVTLANLLSVDEVCDRLAVFGQPMKHDDAVGPRIPPLMLPIGEAMQRMSGLLLLKLDAPDEGSLWYWDRADATWGSDENDALQFLGDDLDALLKRVMKSSNPTFDP